MDAAKKSEVAEEDRKKSLKRSRQATSWELVLINTRKLLGNTGVSVVNIPITC